MNTLLLRTIGAALLIAGTAIGAGMLALPLASAKLGFVPSIGLLGFMCVGMMLSALLTTEVIFRFGQAATIPLISERVFGPIGKVISTTALCLLFYALLAAYISSGSTTLSQITIHSLGDMWKKVPYFQWQIAFTFLFALVTFTKTKGTDLVNRVLFFLKMIFFVLLINQLFLIINSDFLFEARPLSFDLNSPFILAIPVFFTSFGFHGSIPPIIRYIGPHPRHIRSAFIFGSLLPLLIYVIWEACSLGTISYDGAGGFMSFLGQPNELGHFITALSEVSHEQSMQFEAKFFTFLAIATSFIGVAIGLYDFLKEWLLTKRQSGSHINALFMTFILPLGIALSAPDIFVKALAFAAICLSILGVVMPALLAIKMRKTHPFVKEYPSFHLLGGNGLVYLILAFGVFVIAVECLNLAF